MLVEDITYWLASLAALGGVAGLSVFAICHQIGQSEYLCGDCRFNDKSICLKKERPFALSCISYRPNQ